MTLANRPWVPAASEDMVQSIAKRANSTENALLARHIETLAIRNREIHEHDCFNLNPATNVMNPRAERLLASGLGTRPSLGYPGDKYETGLEAIEETEIICAELCAQVFEARYAETRVPSGAIANLYAFMATCKPGDAIIAPPASVGGHVTHHSAGCAGLYGLHTAEAPVDGMGYSVDVEALRRLARKIKPRLITLGASLNLFEHPVREVRQIADEVGAKLLFDAAHQCGIIAGKAWKNPLNEGAHLMTMSTYKSLGGPPSGLIVTNDAQLAERLDAIAFPGMTANFDAAKTAALAMCMLDWRAYGKQYAAQMIAVAQRLARELSARGLPVFAGRDGHTASHQFAVKAAPFGGGQRAAKKLRMAGFLACGIGLPIEEVAGDLNGLRLGTPEIVRFGMAPEHMPALADLLMRALQSSDPASLADETRAMRAQFCDLHYILP